jgi:acyl carrier protein
LENATLPGGSMGGIAQELELGGSCMTMPTLPHRTSTPTGFLANRIRTFIAEHLATDADSISADSHFRDDFGLDLLDVVELTILVEEEFTDGEIAEAPAEIEFVGDLVQHIETYQSRTRASTKG